MILGGELLRSIVSPASLKKRMTWYVAELNWANGSVAGQQILTQVQFRANSCFLLTNVQVFDIQGVTDNLGPVMFSQRGRYDIQLRYGNGTRESFGQLLIGNLPSTMNNSSDRTDYVFFEANEILTIVGSQKIVGTSDSQLVVTLQGIEYLYAS